MPPTAALAIVLLACGCELSHAQTALFTAAQDLKCSVRNVDLIEIGYYQYHAIGCGKDATYECNEAPGSAAIPHSGSGSPVCRRTK